MKKDRSLVNIEEVIKEKFNKLRVKRKQRKGDNEAGGEAIGS